MTRHDTKGHDTTPYDMTRQDTTRKDTKILYIIFLNTLKNLFWKFKFGIKGMYKKLIMSSITVRKGRIKKEISEKKYFFPKIFLCLFVSCRVMSCRVLYKTHVSYRVLSCHLDSLDLTQVPKCRQHNSKIHTQRKSQNCTVITSD